MAKPRIEVQIAAEVGNALNGLKRATEAINQFKAAAGAAGGRITVSLGNAAKRAGVAAREIKTEFSDSFAEVEAAIKASGVSAGNWSQDVTDDMRMASRAMATFGTQVSTSLERASKSLQRGFGRGVIHPSLQSDLLLLNKNLKRVSLTANQVQGSLVGVGRKGAAGIRGGTSAAISFGHIIQDLPYGINGVANNITQLTTQMGYMAASAKAAGVGMKTALIASISNPATLAVLGVSALTTAIVYFTGKVGKAKKETKELKDEVDEYISSLDHLEAAQLKGANRIDSETGKLKVLWTIINDVTTSTENRAKAIEEIQKLFPSYFGALTQEEILADKGADAYARLTQNIIAASNARAAQEELDAATKSIRENNKYIDSQNEAVKSLEARIKAQQAAIKATRDAVKEGTLSPEFASGEIAAREQEINRLNKDIAKTKAAIEKIDVKNKSLTEDRASLEKEILDYTKERINTSVSEADTKAAEEAAKAAEEARKKQIADAKKAAEEIKKASEEAFLASLPAQDKATEKIRLKYVELRAMAELSKEDIVRLNTAEAQEIAASNAKFNAKRLADEAKFREKLAELQRKSFLAGLPDEDAANERIQQQFEKVRAETEKNYQELLALADGNQAAITALNEWYAQRRIEIANEEAAAIMQSNNAFAAKRMAEETKRREAERKAQERVMRDMTNLQEEWARTLSRQLEGVLFEGENIFEAIGSAFKRMISQMIADALAADLVSALFSGKGGGIGGFLGGLLGGGLKGGGIGGFFKGLLNLGRKFAGFAFADGGIVSGPTLGLIGEYPGARSNPEVIAPLSDLQRYIDHSGVAGRVIVEGQIANDVIYLSNKRGAQKMQRYYGLGS